MEDTTKYIFLLLLVFPLFTEAKHGGKQICIILFPETEYYSAVCMHVQISLAAICTTLR